MLNPEQMKELIKLNLKELLKENLTIEIAPRGFGCTIDVDIFFDEEKICGAYIWGSDIENITRKDTW